MQPVTQDNDQVLERLARMADEIFLMRQARNRQMPTDLVGEPAWDILLGLYRNNASATVEELCAWSGVPQSAARRWLEALRQRGLISLSQTCDAKSDKLTLTREGRAVLERALEAMLLVARG